MGFCFCGFFSSIAEIFVTPRNPKTAMCQRASGQVKDFSWEGEKIRERSSISTERKIDGEGKQRENDIYLESDPGMIPEMCHGL